MNTHPIDPSKPRAGFLVAVTWSAGSSIKYARDIAEADELVRDAWERGARNVTMKEVNS